MCTSGVYKLQNKVHNRCGKKTGISKSWKKNQGEKKRRKENKGEKEGTRKKRGEKGEKERKHLKIRKRL